MFQGVFICLSNLSNISKHENIKVKNKIKINQLAQGSKIDLSHFTASYTNMHTKNGKA